MSAGAVTQVVAASALRARVGRSSGAGIGAIVRNIGGAVTAAVLVLFIIPPLVVQLVPEAVSWVPGALAAVLSGVSGEVGVLAAVAVVAAWGIIPAAIGLVFMQRRDVV